MMPTVTLKEAQSRLPDLIHGLSQGDEVVITENDQPVARLTLAALPTEPRKTPQLGTLRGTVLSLEHFDDPLDDLREYME